MSPSSVTLLRTQSDERLVALARAGHERAFEAIVERYRRPLLRHSRRVLPESRAEDALQQALVAAWTALQRGDEVRDLRPWLYRIVHNTALNALRVNGYEYEELRETLEGTGGPVELTERRAIVRDTFAGLAALPERQREALLGIAVQGRTQDEVAEDLGLSSGAVRQLVHRARTSLRAAVTAVTPMPLVHWLAAAERSEPLATRVAELVAGGATAGVGASLAKAGAVAVIAGGAVTAPAVVDKVADRPEPARAATVASAQAPSGGDDDGTLDRGPGDRPAIPIGAAPAAGTGDRSGSGRRGRSASDAESGRGRGRGRGRGGDDRAARAGDGSSGQGRGRGRGRSGDDSGSRSSDDDSSGQGRGRGRSGDDSGSSSSDDDSSGQGRGRGRSGDDSGAASSDGSSGQGRGRGRSGDDSGAASSDGSSGQGRARGRSGGGGGSGGDDSSGRGRSRDAGATAASSGGGDDGSSHGRSGGDGGSDGGAKSGGSGDDSSSGGDDGSSGGDAARALSGTADESGSDDGASGGDDGSGGDDAPESDDD